MDSTSDVKSRFLKKNHFITITLPFFFLSVTQRDFGKWTTLFFRCLSSRARQQGVSREWCHKKKERRQRRIIWLFYFEDYRVDVRFPRDLLKFAVKD